MRAARKKLGLSRSDLASVAGVSYETVKAYELGTRSASARTLERLLQALQLERVQANAIREAAGFAPVRTLFGDVPDFGYSVEELQSAVEQVPWPEFVLNEGLEVVAANRAACALWGVDFREERARRAPTQMNVLAVMNERDFPARLENWDEILLLLASTLKSRPLRLRDLTEPGPYLNQVLDHFVQPSRGFLTELLDAWTGAKPLRAKVRFGYPVRWNDLQHGRMRFLALASPANEEEGLAFHDWHPIDAATWEVLEHVKSGAPPAR